MEFNASIFVSEQLNRQLVNMSQDLAYRAIGFCAEHYHFDAEEAYRLLGLAMIKLERKTQGQGKVKTNKPEKTNTVKAAFPLPYNGELNDNCCYALRQNNGLFTQCTGIRKGENSYCKSCASHMQKMGAETPEYGTIQMRQAAGIFDYTDPKGRKPTPYAKIMKKYKLTEEQVLAEAAKMNMTIDPAHFIMPENSKRGRPKTEKQPKEKTTKGRPKKATKVLQIEGDDDDDTDTFFDALVKEANSEADEIVVKSAEEKEAEKLAKEAEKAAKEAKRNAEKAEKEAKLAAEKAEKEAKKKAEKEAKEAKLAAEKAAKEAKLAAEKEAKEAKKLAEKLAKEAKLAEKEAKKAEKKTEKPANKPSEEPDRCKKIRYNDKKYLQSHNTGVIYDYEAYKNDNELVILGQWNEETNQIDFKNTNNDSDSDVDSEYEM